VSIKNVVCRNCLTVNRVPETRLGDGPKCGRCKQPLFRGVPADLTTQSFQKFIQKNDLPVLLVTHDEEDALAAGGLVHFLDNHKNNNGCSKVQQPQISIAKR